MTCQKKAYAGLSCVEIHAGLSRLRRKISTFYSRIFKPIPSARRLWKVNKFIDFKVVGESKHLEVSILITRYSDIHYRMLT